MAIRHGLAGQYGKKESRWRLKRMMIVFVGVGASSIFATGFAAGLTYGRPRSLSIGLAAVLIPIACVLIWRRTEAYGNRMAKERIRYLRGAQSEAVIAWVLEGLGDEWHIFNSLKLESFSDIDHVLVGPGGLYCISTKSHRGIFTGAPDGLLYNGKPCDFAQQALRQAMNLKDRIGVAMGSDVPWVQSVLALPFGYIEGDARRDKVWLVHQENILDCLVPDDGPRRLSKSQLARTIAVLEEIQCHAAHIYRRPVPD